MNDEPAKQATLVLGVGNLLLSDEGVGVHAVRHLLEAYAFTPTIDLLDGGTAGMDLLDLIGGRETVILIDAVQTGDPPGTLIRRSGAEVTAGFRTKLSPHQLGMSDVLAAATLLDLAPQRLVLIGLVPLSLDLDLAMTPLVADRLPAVVDAVLGELRALGIEARPRS